MASPRQVSYIESLLIDCGLSDRTRRNAWISSELDKEIHYLEELTVDQARIVINELLRIKGDIE